jgi:hypothetical protein
MFIYYHWVNTTVGGFVSSEERKTPQTWIMYKMGGNFLGDCNLIFSLKLTL